MRTPPLKAWGKAGIVLEAQCLWGAAGSDGEGGYRGRPFGVCMPLREAQQVRAATVCAPASTAAGRFPADVPACWVPSITATGNLTRMEWSPRVRGCVLTIQLSTWVPHLLLPVPSNVHSALQLPGCANHERGTVQLVIHLFAMCKELRLYVCGAVGAAPRAQQREFCCTRNARGKGNPPLEFYGICLR